MVRRPSYQAEECVALREESGGREYLLIYTRADRNIWYSTSQDVENGDDQENRDGRGDKGMKGDNVRVNVVRMTKPLDRNRAIRVYELWARMLRGVRYPDQSFAGWLEDGETFEFRCMGRYGETRTPSSGAPKMLVDVGHLLILCCQSQNDELAKNLTLLDKKCEELEKFLRQEKVGQQEKERGKDVPLKIKRGDKGSDKGAGTFKGGQIRGQERMPRT